MCGRYFLQLTDRDRCFFREQLFHQEKLDFRQGEVFPSQHALVLWNSDGAIVPTVMKWGLPGYRGGLLINARMEGIEAKRTFRPMLRQRCAVVANGFFEWRKNGSRKEKFYIRKENSPLIYFAALYNRAHEFVIVTGAARQEMSRIHERTPLLMKEDAMRDYLTRHRDFMVDNERLLIEQIQMIGGKEDEISSNL